jgi:ornithine decarboxylase
MEKRNIFEFISNEELESINEFSKNKETPFIIISLNRISKNYDYLKNNLPFAKIYYAVKANPDVNILKLLNKKGSFFDIATIYELDLLLDLGVSPDRISFGNTIKKEKDIAYAFNKGIRLFVTDSESDVINLSKNAPGSKIFIRLLSSGGNADWPLSKKFGTNPDDAFYLAIKSKELGLIPYGLSFHVGSQQREISQWDIAIASCKYLFDSLKKGGIDLKLINMGGGFPSKYMLPTPELQDYCSEIKRYLNEDFLDNFPEIIVEPGRSLVADAGVMVTEIVMISKKTTFNNSWIFIDAGKFNGLIETIDESIKYPIFAQKDIKPKKTNEVIFAGPTCDSMDILYENYKYQMSTELKEKDILYILSTGAYTYSYASVCFNGFPPIKVYITDKFE